MISRTNNTRPPDIITPIATYRKAVSFTLFTIKFATKKPAINAGVNNPVLTRLSVVTSPVMKYKKNAKSCHKFNDNSRSFYFTSTKIT